VGAYHQTTSSHAFKEIYMQLSKHFKLEEFEKSMTATRMGIPNKAGSGEINSLTDICYNILEPVRAKFDKPVIITSGYRSPELCEAIGSKKTSQHTKGEAVDFEVVGIPNIKIAYWIQANCDFDQLILEYYCPNDGQKGWVHCSYSDKSNRKQVLTFDGKKYDNNLPDMKWEGGEVKE
tara:strand:- start:247 stop:780 length:534 start_codon:yes stop_codon:yes gene_type:complete